MKQTLNLSPSLDLVRDEALAMGVSFPALLTADVVRYRRLAAEAMPQLTEWEWGLVSHVMDGIEAHDILTGLDRIPGAWTIAIAIDEWADGASDDEAERAKVVRVRAIRWSPLAIAGILFRMRGEIARKQP